MGVEGEGAQNCSEACREAPKGRPKRSCAMKRWSKPDQRVPVRLNGPACGQLHSRDQGVRHIPPASASLVQHGLWDHMCTHITNRTVEKVGQLEPSGGLIAQSNAHASSGHKALLPTDMGRGYFPTGFE